MLVTKSFLLSQEQTSADFTSCVSKLGPTAHTINILCVQLYHHC